MDWKVNNSYIIGHYGKVTLDKNKPVAGFDLDGTIIEPTGGKKFSQSDDDWKFYNSKETVDKLIKYHKNGFTIVIYTNQNGISLGRISKEKWMNKINKIAKIVKIPFIIVASLLKDNSRKPRTILWEKIIPCDINRSFYCGDAGGLPKRKINGTIIKKDFSDSDLKFAYNLGIKFIHRDEFIYSSTKCKPIVKYIDFNTIRKGDYDKFTPNQQELIIMVGFPASGKSYYVNKYIVPQNYDYINQDTLKTVNKCIKMCEISIKQGNSCVIDNTNPNIDKRKKYIDIAKKYGVKCRCIHFITSRELSVHNNNYRNLTTDKKLVPTIAYNIYNKKLQEPKEDEGFYKIDKISFVLNDKIINKYYYMAY